MDGFRKALRLAVLLGATGVAATAVASEPVPWEEATKAEIEAQEWLDEFNIRLSGIERPEGAALTARGDLRRKEAIRGVMLRPVKDMKGITGVWLKHCVLDDEATSIIMSLPDVAFLDLSYSELPLNGMAILEKAKHLKGLDLTGFALTDESIVHITELRNLEHLDLLRNPLLTDQGVAHIARLTNLKYLDLRACKNLTDASLKHIAACKNLEKLDISQLPLLTDAGLKHLHVLADLKYLRIDQFKDFSADAIADLQRALPNCEITD